MNYLRNTARGIGNAAYENTLLQHLRMTGIRRIIEVLTRIGNVMKTSQEEQRDLPKQTIMNQLPLLNQPIEQFEKVKKKLGKNTLTYAKVRYADNTLSSFTYRVENDPDDTFDKDDLFELTTELEHVIQSFKEI